MSTKVLYPHLNLNLCISYKKHNRTTSLYCLYASLKTTHAERSSSAACSNDDITGCKGRNPSKSSAELTGLTRLFLANSAKNAQMCALLLSWFHKSHSVTSLEVLKERVKELVVFYQETGALSATHAQRSSSSPSFSLLLGDSRSVQRPFHHFFFFFFGKGNFSEMTRLQLLCSLLKYYYHYYYSAVFSHCFSVSSGVSRGRPCRTTAADGEPHKSWGARLGAQLSHYYTSGGFYRKLRSHTPGGGTSPVDETPSLLLLRYNGNGGGGKSSPYSCYYAFPAAGLSTKCVAGGRVHGAAGQRAPLLLFPRMALSSVRTPSRRRPGSNAVHGSGSGDGAGADLGADAGSGSGTAASSPLYTPKRFVSSGCGGGGNKDSSDSTSDMGSTTASKSTRMSEEAGATRDSQETSEKASESWSNSSDSSSTNHPSRESIVVEVEPTPLEIYHFSKLLKLPDKFALEGSTAADDEKAAAKGAAGGKDVSGNSKTQTSDDGIIGANQARIWTVEEIKKNYREAAQHYHPDVIASRGQRGQELNARGEVITMEMINTAYKYLLLFVKDEGQKASYIVWRHRHPFPDLIEVDSGNTSVSGVAPSAGDTSGSGSGNPVNSSSGERAAGGAAAGRTATNPDDSLKVLLGLSFYCSLLSLAVIYIIYYYYYAGNTALFNQKTYLPSYQQSGSGADATGRRSPGFLIPLKRLKKRVLRRRREAAVASGASVMSDDMDSSCSYDINSPEFYQSLSDVDKVLYDNCFPYFAFVFYSQCVLDFLAELYETYTPLCVQAFLRDNSEVVSNVCLVLMAVVVGRFVLVRRRTRIHRRSLRGG